MKQGRCLLSPYLGITRHLAKTPTRNSSALSRERRRTMQTRPISGEARAIRYLEVPERARARIRSSRPAIERSAPLAATPSFGALAIAPCCLALASPFADYGSDVVSRSIVGKGKEAQAGNCAGASDDGPSDTKFDGTSLSNQTRPRRERSEKRRGRLRIVEPPSLPPQIRTPVFAPLGSSIATALFAYSVARCRSSILCKERKDKRPRSWSPLRDAFYSN